MQVKCKAWWGEERGKVYYSWMNRRAMTGSCAKGKHFCGGENESDLMPAMKRLGDNGQVWELSSTAPQRRTSTQLHAATTVRIPIASGR